jgi:transketolase
MLKPIGKGIANLECMAAVLTAHAENDSSIIVVTSDSRGSGKVTGFAQRFPRQLVEVGIAEQNSVGISAGLASCNKKVFTISPGSFLSARALEQVKNDVAYSQNPVALIGISSGVSYGGLGATHHSIHDLAVLQAIPGLEVIVPADNNETEAALISYLENPRPVYIRFGKKAMPSFYQTPSEVKIGKVSVLNEGDDLLILAIGEPLWQAYDAAVALENSGVRCSLASVHTLCPIDREAIIELASHSRAIITVEEHSVYGGLGSTVAALLMEAGIYRPMKIIGFPREEMVTGSQTDLFRHYGIDADNIRKNAMDLLNRN